MIVIFIIVAISIIVILYFFEPNSFRLLHHRALGSRFYKWKSKSKYTWDDVLIHELHELTVKTRFTGRDRRRLGGITLPHNPQQVLLWPWSGVDHLLILCFWNFSISIVTGYHMTIESRHCHFRLLLSRTRCFVELMRGEETYSWAPAKIERWQMPFLNEISETLPVCPRSGYTTHPNWVSSWSRQSRPRFVFGNVFYFFIIFHQRKISNDILSLSGCWLECFRRGLESGRRSSGLFIMVRQPSPGGDIEIMIMIKFSNRRRTSWTKIMIMIMIGEHLGQRGSTS